MYSAGKSHGAASLRLKQRIRSQPAPRAGCESIGKRMDGGLFAFLPLARSARIGIGSETRERRAAANQSPQECCPASRSRRSTAACAYSLIHRSCIRLIGSGASVSCRSFPFRRPVTKSARSSTRRCCRTVVRSSSENKSQSRPVVRDSCRSASSIRRRSGEARALNTRSSPSDPLRATSFML